MCAIFYILLSGLDSPTEMFVTWSTVDDIKPSLPSVEFGIKSINEYKVTGTSKYFQDPGPMNLTQYIHRVTLKNLSLGTDYSRYYIPKN